MIHIVLNARITVLPFQTRDKRMQMAMGKAMHVTQMQMEMEY